MSEGKSTQVDLAKGLPQMSDDNDSTSPVTTQEMRADMEDSGSKIESPTPEKPESRRQRIVISSLARNLLAERYKDRFADQLLGDEDETDGEYDNDNISSGGSQSLVSGSIDIGAFPKDQPNELLEKHKNLLNLFNRMESSIRLLRLRKKMTTFKNIATQVEVLTKRKFLCTHLAQIKHLFPEAIQIKKILLHDDKSLCMYGDMEITLLMDAVECRNTDQSPSMAICEAFHSKLLTFLESHEKDMDIPEATLPEPFNSREKLCLEAPHNGHSAEPPLHSYSENGFLNASHFPQSFQKLMSQKIIAEGAERTQLLSDPAKMSSLSVDGAVPDRSSNKHVFIPVKTDISATPNGHLISSYQESTPKHDISNSPMMAETPAMHTPKRPLPTSLEKLETTSGHSSEVRSTSSVRRSLIMFSSSKFEESPSDHDVDTSKLEKGGAILITEHKVTAEKCLFPEEACTFTNSLVENDKDKTNDVPTLNSQEKLDSLRVTFDLVCDISQSTKNLLMTKQELFHNILANNLEIEETGEIEEQLHILEDLSPDWISKKVVHGGEILYSIKQIQDQKSVRERLVEAICT